MSKEVATKESTALANFDDSQFEDMGPEQDLTANDIQIPKILIMQAGSPRVLDAESAFGDLVDTQNWKKFGSLKEGGFEFIPFFWKKCWVYREQDGDKWKFHSIEDIDRTNEEANMFEEWKDKTTGKLMKRVYTHFFHGLIPGEPIPYSLAFRGGSKKHGDALVTQMYVSNKNLKVDEAWKRSPMAKVIKITPNKTNNKKGDTYIEMLASVGRDSTKEEAIEALQWYNSVKAGKAKADYADHDEELSKSQPTGTVPDDVEF